MKTIYLDNQATTPVKSSVIKDMKPFWADQFGNPHSNEHYVGLLANQHIVNAKYKIATAIQAEEDEIFFTSGATESNNHSIFALCALSQRRSERQIIISPLEHKCIIEAAHYWASIFNLEVVYVNVDECGYIDLDHLESLLKKPTLFCSIIGVNNEIGTIQDLTILGDIIHSHGAVFHSDLAQAPKSSNEAMDFQSVDLASFSGHKIGGPPGIGCLFISAEWQSEIQPLIHGGGQQLGIRSGTLPLPLSVGLGSAFSYLNKDDIAKMKLLRDHLYEGLKDNIPDLMINGPELSKRHAGNLNVRFTGVKVADLIASLQPKIAVSSGSACGSGNIEPSYVIEAISGDFDRASESMRLSVHENQKKDHIEMAVEIISQKYQQLKI